MMLVGLTIGILLTVIGMIDGLVAFWVRITQPVVPVTMPIDVVKVLTVNKKMYYVRSEHVAKFGLKFFDDVDGVPTNPACMKVLKGQEVKIVVAAHPSVIEPMVNQKQKDLMYRFIESFRCFDAEWDDVNEVVFGTGLIIIGITLLLMVMPIGALFMMYGAYKVM